MLMSPLTTRASFDHAEAEGVARYWPFLLLGGLISFVFGALILTIDWSVESLGTFIGVLYVVQGVSLAVTRPLDGSGRCQPGGRGARGRRRDRVDRLAGQGHRRRRRLRRHLHRVFRVDPRCRSACEPPGPLLVAHARPRPDRGTDRHLGDATAGHARRHRHARRRLGGGVRDLAVRHGLRGAERRSPARCNRSSTHREARGSCAQLPNPCNCIGAARDSSPFVVHPRKTR